MIPKFIPPLFNNTHGVGIEVRFGFENIVLKGFINPVILRI